MGVVLLRNPKMIMMSKLSTFFFLLIFSSLPKRNWSEDQHAMGYFKHLFSVSISPNTSHHLLLKVFSDYWFTSNWWYCWDQTWSLRHWPAHWKLQVLNHIIVYRWRPLMNKLVSPNQVDFIRPRRQMPFQFVDMTWPLHRKISRREITDNIFIAQEVLNCLEDRFV